MEAKNRRIVKLCKELGCCDACCIRYIGLKSPEAYAENSKKFIRKYLDVNVAEKSENTATIDEKVESKEDEPEGTPAKKIKIDDVCVSCLGILQEKTWPACVEMVKKTMEEKQYKCKAFASALSAPLSTIIHERAVSLTLEEKEKEYDKYCLTPLKEAWKWCFGLHLAAEICMEMESGAVAPLLITLIIEYGPEAEEISHLRALYPSPFPRGAATRRAVEAAAALLTRAQWDAMPTRGEWARCASVQALHVPLYLGGRYIKTSRTLPQTPWILEGKRIMESSVQEIIFEPIAEAYGIGAERLKFMSAGREDVDVRCLGSGRPFAVEITDPRRELSADELKTVCENITKSGSVRVYTLVHVTKERLADLKKGEETKEKTYELLCINLDTDRPLPLADARVSVSQRTPLRVLHRRSLARRTRALSVAPRAVPGHPALCVLTVRAQAGTYIKEWAHGEAGRSAPAAAALGAPLDILALDLREVHLAWP